MASKARIVALAGSAGLWLFSLGGGFSTAAINTGLWLMIFAFLAERRWDDEGKYNRDPLVWAVSLFTAYVIARGVWAWVEFPMWRAEVVGDTKALVAVGGLGAFVVGAWLHRSPRIAYTALVLALAGLLVGLLYNMEWAYLDRYVGGRRAYFGIGGNGPGMYGSAAVLGMIILGLPAVWRWRPVYRYIGMMLGTVAMAVFLLAVIWNQSRSSWLAAALVFPFAVLVPVVVRRRAFGWTSIVSAGSVAVVLIALVAVFASPAIEKRLQYEKGTIWSVVQLDWEIVPARRSVGTRINMWQVGAESFAERPLFGWGPGTAKMLLEEVDYQRRSFGHFHNLYLHLLVELGIVGFVLAGAVVVLFGRNLVRRNELGFQYLVFTVGAMAMFMIASVFQIRYDDPYGTFYMIFLGALMLAGFFPRNEAEEPNST